MEVLYQLSYVGAEGNRIAAALRLSEAVGKPTGRDRSANGWTAGSGMRQRPFKGWVV
jgi:hypothetical protein